MGFFAKFRMAARQAQAAAMLERLFDAQLRAGVGVDAPSRLLASKLVQVLCDRNPELLTARPMLTKVSLAAAALVSGANTMQKTGDRATELALASCLASLMMEVTGRADLNFSPLDLRMFAAAEDVIARVAR